MALGPMSLAESTAHDVRSIIGVVFLAIFPLSMLIVSGFWNHGNTLEINLVAVIVTSAIGAIPAGLCVLVHWFKHRAKLDPPPHWNLKKDSPGTWVLTGVGAAVLVVSAISWASYLLVGVLTQYVSGTVSDISGQIIVVEHHTYRKRRCDVAVEFKLGWDEHAKVCIVPRTGEPLTNTTLKVGETVVLRTSQSFFGTSLVWVSRPEPTNKDMSRSSRDISGC
jgi:hypothetical protein